MTQHELKQTTIELLAPAKDAACGMTAIDCGADAVYIGAPRFGARENAGNSLEDIASLLKHAHAYWAKVYATVNTLLRDDEIPPALDLIARLYDLGIDGLIIQDVGLLECELPPLPLIASTQMHNHTPERIALLEGVGIKRAILARELGLDEIKAIRARTTLELECFIHGALCVGYSGQCYLSYALGGRSGNRGQCAQPCRKPYTLVDGNGRVLIRDRHLLSLRDLNLTDELEALIDAGVTAFKIEGRLKDRAYVMNVVSHYRARLDTILARKGMQKYSSGHSTVDFTPDVTKTFNRGYCTAFLHGRDAKIGSPETPKMTGERIGTVTAVTPRAFVLDSAVPLNNGDGLCFFTAQHELTGTVVKVVNGHNVMPEKMDNITEGTVIYRNHDHAFLTQLEKARAERLIEVTLTLADTPDGFRLTAVDEDDNTTAVTLATEKVAAEKPEQALATIRKQLAKTGGTAYTCSDVVVDIPAYFIPVATLNAVRRDVLDALTTARAANRPVATGGAIRNELPFPTPSLTFTGNVLNSRAEAFYRHHGVTQIEPAAESGLDLRGRVVMTTKYCLKHQLDRCPRYGGKGDAEALTLRDAEGHVLELRFDCKRCEMQVVKVR